jgi:hypothetical protein
MGRSSTVLLLSLDNCRDVCGFADVDDVDPQLRGCVAILLGTVMRGALIESAGDLELWFNGRRLDHLDIVEKMR